MAYSVVYESSGGVGLETATRKRSVGGEREEDECLSYLRSDFQRNRMSLAA